MPPPYNGAVILAGDIGGTKTQLGLFVRAGRRLRRVREECFSSQNSPSLEAIVARFLAEGNEKVSRCAMGAAGPVTDGRTGLVNLKWPVDGKRLARMLGLSDVLVLNDLEATAWSIPHLGSTRIRSLTPGLRPRAGNAAVIAPGTGLGMAILFWDGKRHRVSASEGGHQGFVPRDELEIDLLRYARRRLGRVSVERIVAGPGLSLIYRFLIDAGAGEESPLMGRRLQVGDPNAAVCDAGVAGEDPTAERAVEVFVSLLGAAAGDLALVARATAGVYVAGGIAPRMLARLRSGTFLRSFRAKGRLTALIEKIPVRVIVEPRAPLLGAAACAAFGGAPATRRRGRSSAKR